MPDKTAGAPLRIRLLRECLSTTPLAVVGDSVTLAAAYENDSPVTFDADAQFAGESVYLGHTRMVYDLEHEAVAPQRSGLHQQWTHPEFGQLASYYIDQKRLQDAPRIAEKLREIHGSAARRAQAAYAQAEAEERELAREDY